MWIVKGILINITWLVEGVLLGFAFFVTAVVVVRATRVTAFAGWTAKNPLSWIALVGMLSLGLVLVGIWQRP